MSTDPQPHSDEKKSANTSGEETLDSTPHQTESKNPVSALTILQFHFGRKGAIETIAGSRQAIWLGLGFVICAGLFREYDQEDLLHEPWFLLIPLLASTLLFLILLLIVELRTNRSRAKQDGLSNARKLLTCFWMCAPMAILYAIPVEQLFAPLVATKFNITVLAIVSAWRVLLMSRILSLLYPLSFWQALYPVLLLSDSLVLFAMTQVRLPLLQIMGGVQLTAAEEFVMLARNWILTLGVASWPFWFAGIFIVHRKSQRIDSLPEGEKHYRKTSVSLSSWVLLASFFVGILIGAAKMQPLQQRAFHYRTLIEKQEYKAAVRYVSHFYEEDFPTQWDPPPKFEIADQGKSFLKALEGLDDPLAPKWFRERLGQRLVRIRGWGYYSERFFPNRTNEELETIAAFLKRNPEWIPQLEQGEYALTICEFIQNATDELESESSEHWYLHPTVTMETLQLLSDALPSEMKCAPPRELAEDDSPTSAH